MTRYARQWALVSYLLLAAKALAAPAPERQIALQPASITHSSSHRPLHGRFLHITDLHPDEIYKPHSSTEENIACHREHGPAGVYGAETSDCDSPLSLVNATLAWVKENLRDEIDFVIWTGDSARHDSDEENPRHDKDILAMNRHVANAFIDTFSDEHNDLVIPIVPTFGNNDIYPHNILLPGPNNILKSYSKIWGEFIPEEQRHAFEFGGWFYIETIPNKLAVFSLNTMYFFDRNAGVDDCLHPSEPGYKQFEWLRIQLQSLRERGMKAMLMGHVPPARTEGKQLWDETCWQKYTLWLQQYRDIIVGGLYGHMNIDHFLLQDTKEIDFALLDYINENESPISEPREEDFSIQSSADYLKDLRDDWAKLPDPKDLKAEKSKGRKKKKNKLGSPYAERYQLTLIAPSVVPNYFPSLRVVEYNTTGLEHASTWAEAKKISKQQQNPHELAPEIGELKRSHVADFEIEKKKKKKEKKPQDPNLHIPKPPKKGSPPGPAYYPQTLTLTGYTQYFANLTFINNDITGSSLDNSLSLSGWNSGKHRDKTPKNKEPQPREFNYQLEYSTFDDKLYKLDDLTVKSFVELAHRIGQASSEVQSDSRAMNDDDGLEDIGYLDLNDVDDSSSDSNIETSKKKKKKNEKKKKKGRKGKNTKLWLHFLKHAFVSTRTEKELEDV
ncbi:Metallo-dependent phosphatase-like protein [Xylariaceae sp. FL0255]|nr:Metallo-dependent phosphatase-like protein [Xylariaceae sp. FL0255]